MDDSRELIASLLICLGLSGGYVAYSLLAEPSGGHPIGHTLGIVGTLLMVSTEILYSLRKRTTWLRWAGPVRYWLSVHIVTGIVGPFLVLAHTAFEFRGLAGLTVALTALVVASGFLGRYLYTAIPRSLAGVEVSAVDLARAIDVAQQSVLEFVGQHSSAVQQLVAADAARQQRSGSSWALVLVRGPEAWFYRRQLHARIRAIERAENIRLDALERLLRARRDRERELRMMQSARRLLSLWHIAHVPMGVALFGAVAIHVAAEIYFGAGLMP